jgi:hypothetical protein
MQKVVLKQDGGFFGVKTLLREQRKEVYLIVRMRTSRPVRLIVTLQLRIHVDKADWNKRSGGNEFGAQIHSKWKVASEKIGSHCRWVS